MGTESQELEKWDLYFASPLFTRGEVNFNNAVVYELDRMGLNVYNPGDYENKAHHGDPEDLVQHHIGAVRASRALVLNIDGDDTGASFEAGVAYAEDVPILYFWTDKRRGMAEWDTNWMLTQNRAAYSLMASHGGPKPMIPNPPQVAEAIHDRFRELERKGLLNDERDF